MLSIAQKLDLPIKSSYPHPLKYSTLEHTLVLAFDSLPEFKIQNVST